MTSKAFPTDTLDQAALVLAACKQIDPALKLGTQGQEAFADTIAETKAIQAQINGIEIQLTNLRNHRDEQIVGIWDTIKRVRSTVKGTYGDDSSEYELVGGTRISERRKPTRRVVS